LLSIPHIEAEWTAPWRFTIHQPTGGPQVDLLLKLEAEGLVGEGVKVEATEVTGQNGIEVSLPVTLIIGSEFGEAAAWQSDHRDSPVRRAGHVLVTSIVVLDPDAPLE
jgi:hypothetical protein